MPCAAPLAGGPLPPGHAGADDVRGVGEWCGSRAGMAASVPLLPREHSRLRRHALAPRAVALPNGHPQVPAVRVREPEPAHEGATHTGQAAGRDSATSGAGGVRTLASCVPRSTWPLSRPRPAVRRSWWLRGTWTWCSSTRCPSTSGSPSGPRTWTSTRCRCGPLSCGRAGQGAASHRSPAQAGSRSPMCSRHGGCRCWRTTTRCWHCGAATAWCWWRTWTSTCSRTGP